MDRARCQGEVSWQDPKGVEESRRYVLQKEGEAGWEERVYRPLEHSHLNRPSFSDFSHMLSGNLIIVRPSGATYTV